MRWHTQWNNRQSELRPIFNLRVRAFFAIAASRSA